MLNVLDSDSCLCVAEESVGVEAKGLDGVVTADQTAALGRQQILARQRGRHLLRLQPKGKRSRQQQRSTAQREHTGTVTMATRISIESASARVQRCGWSRYAQEKKGEPMLGGG